MASVTYYVALPFVSTEDGVVPGEPVPCLSTGNAVSKAETLARRPSNVGAVAFCRSGDPVTGEFAEARVLRMFGEVPSDLDSLAV